MSYGWKHIYNFWSLSEKSQDVSPSAALTLIIIFSKMALVIVPLFNGNTKLLDYPFNLIWHLYEYKKSQIPLVFLSLLMTYFNNHHLPVYQRKSLVSIFWSFDTTCNSWVKGKLFWLIWTIVCPPANIHRNYAFCNVHPFDMWFNCTFLCIISYKRKRINASHLLWKGHPEVWDNTLNNLTLLLS